MSRLPLEGVRVVDFGHYIAGPLAARLLADQGAEVTHVDPPGGPRWRSPANSTLNRGKRGIELDLRTSADLSQARELVAAADVVVENFRPGVMHRLGLGADMSLRDNPRLIYCSLPGFATDDPRSNMQGWEGIIGAATDTYRADPPQFTQIPISSHFAAIQAALAIVMALIARARDGLGQRIEVPLFDATFAAIGAHGLFVDGAPGGVRPDDFWTGLFECADGRWIQLSAATPQFRRQLASALRLEDWQIDLEQLSVSTSLQADLRARQKSLFATRSALEWESLGADIGVPIAMCRTPREWTDTQHAHSSGAMQRPIRIGGTTSGATPRSSGSQGGALAGVRVLDLSQVLAGPTAGRTLAEYGADVIKINNPHEEGAGIHFSRHRYHTDVNRGKRSLLLDLKTSEGRSILHDLVARSDVVIQNFRPDAASRLSVTYDDLRAIRPDVVYLTVSAFGEPGPWTGRPGYEVQAQAAAGLRWATHGQPQGQPFAVNDYGTGLLGAFAAALGFYQRQQTGAGQQVEAALAYTATLLQSATLHADIPPVGESLGWSASQRLYAARDGWLFAAAALDEPEIASASVHEVVERLTREGIAAHALTSIDELRHDQWVLDHGLLITRTHDTGERITTIGPAVRMSRTPPEPGRPTPSPGVNAEDVLRELDRASELDALRARGVIAIESPVATPGRA